MNGLPRFSEKNILQERSITHNISRYIDYLIRYSEEELNKLINFKKEFEKIYKKGSNYEASFTDYIISKFPDNQTYKNNIEKLIITLNHLFNFIIHNFNTNKIEQNIKKYLENLKNKTSIKNKIKENDRNLKDDQIEKIFKHDYLASQLNWFFMINNILELLPDDIQNYIPVSIILNSKRYFFDFYNSFIKYLIISIETLYYRIYSDILDTIDKASLKNEIIIMLTYLEKTKLFYMYKYCQFLKGMKGWSNVEDVLIDTFEHYSKIHNHIIKYFKDNKSVYFHMNSSDVDLFVFKENILFNIHIPIKIDDINCLPEMTYQSIIPIEKDKEQNVTFIDEENKKIQKQQKDREKFLKRITAPNSGKEYNDLRSIPVKNKLVDDLKDFENIIGVVEYPTKSYNSGDINPDMFDASVFDPTIERYVPAVRKIVSTPPQSPNSSKKRPRTPETGKRGGKNKSKKNTKPKSKN